MTDCLFCKIVRREIPAKLVFDDDQLIVIEDINPQAQMHVLVIPKQHISTLNDLTSETDTLVGNMVRRAAAVARERGFADRGYRAVFNTNHEAGQTVFHIHLHALAGRRLAWPPG